VQHGAKLFHAIVIVGSAFGTACGGTIVPSAPSPSPDASSDAPSEVGDEVGHDAVAELPSPDASAASDARSAEADAHDAPVGDPCAQPGSNAPACVSPNCCIAGGCFPCFV
jgi:hypothetical protein